MRLQEPMTSFPLRPTAGHGKRLAVEVFHWRRPYAGLILPYPRNGKLKNNLLNLANHLSFRNEHENVTNVGNVTERAQRMFHYHFLRVGVQNFDLGGGGEQIHLHRRLTLPSRSLNYFT